MLKVKQPNISHNAALNFLGQGLQILAALICMPFISKSLGLDRFGLLSLVWVVVGYFSILDFGLGPAVTKTISEAVSDGEKHRIPAIFWTATRLQMVLGLVGLVLISLLTPILNNYILQVPPNLIGEATISLYLCAAAFPLVLVSSSVVGFLQAFQRFDMTNVVQVPLSVAQFVLPLLCGLWWPNLAFVVAVLIASRVLALVFLFIFAKNIFPPLLDNCQFNKKEFQGLFRFGGWLTVSNGISPLMVYADRFVLGSLQTISAVAYYSVPCDAVMRLLIVPRSLMPVLFPVFSGTKDPDRINELCLRSIKYILLMVGVPVIILIVFANEIMAIWMGQQFAVKSSFPLQILSIGILACSIGQVPYSLAQAVGRVEITAKMHLFEFPFYILFACFCVVNWGVSGAAIAWSARLIIETVILFFVAYRVASLSLVGAFAERIPQLFVFLIIMATSGVVINEMLPWQPFKGLFVIIYAACFGCISWMYFLVESDRCRFYNIFSGVLNRCRKHL